MKRTFIFFMILGCLAMTGCGVKSELAHPNPDYPRDYPVY